MCSSKECAEYFKKQNAYRRCFEKLRKKWMSYGRLTGRITLRDTSEEERRAIGGVVGKVFFEKDIQFSAAEFEQGLQRTRFAPVDMKKVLEAYFGETISTNQDRKQEKQKETRAFLEGLCVHFQESGDRESIAFLWISDVLLEKRYGYQILVREYGKDPDAARKYAVNVGNALIKLKIAQEEEKECPLAVFAAAISGNPHYFDRGTVAGQLLIHAICCWKKSNLPENAHQWREMLVCAGIVPDNVSSLLHVYGLRLRTKEGWHPAYEAFCARKEPCVITMENLKEITGVQAVGDCVYVVENEMVFSYLIDNVKSEKLTLLCTSGQLRAVALELIRMILETEVSIYYSGDIDPDGIGIADRLRVKFGQRIRIWRMTPRDYRISISGEQIGASGLAKLENIKTPLLRETASCVRENGMAAYQENLLEELQNDIRQGGGSNT